MGDKLYLSHCQWERYSPRSISLLNIAQFGIYVNKKDNAVNKKDTAALPNAK